MKSEPVFNPVTGEARAYLIRPASTDEAREMQTGEAFERTRELREVEVERLESGRLRKNGTRSMKRVKAREERIVKGERLVGPVERPLARYADATDPDRLIEAPWHFVAPPA